MLARPLVSLLLLLVVMATAGLAAINDRPEPASLGMAEPVRVDFYMEALCPYCAEFTQKQLQPLFANKLINFVQLQLIPYGNAHTDPNTGAVTCQHGEVECQLNKLLSCATALNPVQDDFFPFLTCIEEAGQKGIQPEQVETVAQSCAVHAGLVPSKLMDCYKGQLGNTLQRLAAERTASLKPPHQYVPWVVVNGIPLLDDDENIMRYICVAYRGRDRPKACLDVPPPSAQQRAASTHAAKATAAAGAAVAQMPQTQKQTQHGERCKPGMQTVQDTVTTAVGAGDLSKS